MPDPPRIHVVHATSPACHWSWGYEAGLNRLRLVYGDQIELHLRVGAPYESREQWLLDYGMTAKETEDWVNGEMSATMGVPLAKVEWAKQPETTMPAALALIAALRQGEEAWRFQRALVRMFALEGKDPSQDATIRAALQETTLDAKRFWMDYADKDALREAFEHQHGPPLHVGFFNLGVWDGANRKVILDYAFDPQDVEGAIDYLSGGALRKEVPTDVVGYLRRHGLAPLSELGRVFGWSPEEAQARIEAYEKKGDIERATLAGAPHWKAV